MSGRIVAVLGSESHTTSRGWANLYINGIKVSHRKAFTKEWKTDYKDKHASWCECVFTVKPGDKVRWEAGANSGNRGANRTRIDQTYIFDPTADVAEIEGPGAPARSAILRGRLVLESDILADAKAKHSQIANSL